MIKQAFVVDGVRTPIGSFAGALSGVRTDDLAAHVIRELVARHEVLDRSLITDVVLGCANQAGEDNRNVARMALLLAGLPASVPGETVNRLCASGLSALAAVTRGIQCGEGEIYIAGGVESMTRAPYVTAKAETAFARTVETFDTSIGWRFVNPKMQEAYGIDSMGATAENVAEEFSISRDDQDRFALNSQQKAAKARSDGRFTKEIVAIDVPAPKRTTKRIDTDEFIRPDTSMETLERLKPAFRSDGRGTVTAGNSSGINDGACALLVASEEAVARFKLRPLARVVATAAAGIEPRIMGMGPVAATQKVLQFSGITLDKIGVIELNEAFAAQSVACIRAMGLRDSDTRINPNGGAIALGHPLGMSGARLVLTAAHELQLRNERYALCTMCVGVGQGMAMIIERA